ncbi:carboxylesterase family protein [Pyrenophora tritici-repentis]|nr:carboxylesterase family protein [Pyrenophora tritici-repentis]
MRFLLNFTLAISELFMLISGSTAAPTTSTYPSPPPHTPVVAIKNGSIAGIHNAVYAQDIFLGIPYATPPTGLFRLQRPQPALGWNGTRQASSYPPCSDARYNGSFLVQKSVAMKTPIVFVSINYRLGLFGFLAGAAIERAGLTNNGYRDQRLALEWIQENIAAFGGIQGVSLFTVHDDFFPELPSTLLAQGRFAHVPVILGTNRNEGTTIPLTAPINTVQDFTVAVLTVRGYPASVAQKLWHLYGNEVDNPSVAGLGSVSRTQGPELGQEFSRASLWIGDDYFTFSRRLYNEIWAKACVPSYSYFFDVPPADAFLNTSIYGVPHFAEIPYVFANSEAVGWETNPIRQGDDDKDRYNKVVDLMSRMWYLM